MSCEYTVISSMVLFEQCSSSKNRLVFVVVCRAVTFSSEELHTVLIFIKFGPLHIKGKET